MSEFWRSDDVDSHLIDGLLEQGLRALAEQLLERVLRRPELDESLRAFYLEQLERVRSTSRTREQ